MFHAVRKCDATVSWPGIVDAGRLVATTNTSTTVSFVAAGVLATGLFSLPALHVGSKRVGVGHCTQKCLLTTSGPWLVLDGRSGGVRLGLVFGSLTRCPFFFGVYRCRSIALRHTLAGGWPSPWSRPVCADVSWCRCRTPLVLHSRCRSTLTTMVRVPSRRTNSLTLSRRTLTCAQESYSGEFLLLACTCSLSRFS